MGKCALALLILSCVLSGCVGFVGYGGGGGGRYYHHHDWG